MLHFAILLFFRASLIYIPGKCKRQLQEAQWQQTDNTTAEDGFGLPSDKATQPCILPSDVCSNGSIVYSKLNSLDKSLPTYVSAETELMDGFRALRGRTMQSSMGQSKSIL